MYWPAGRHARTHARRQARSQPASQPASQPCRQVVARGAGPAYLLLHHGALVPRHLHHGRVHLGIAHAHAHTHACTRRHCVRGRTAPSRQQKKCERVCFRAACLGGSVCVYTMSCSRPREGFILPETLVQNGTGGGNGTAGGSLHQPVLKYCTRVSGKMKPL